MVVEKLPWETVVEIQNQKYAHAKHVSHGLGRDVVVGHSAPRGVVAWRACSSALVEGSVEVGGQWLEGMPLCLS